MTPNPSPIPPEITNALQQIKLPASGSHKGQNGKLLIIGGSELFHAASKWSLDVASKFVDMVFYSSVPINNELVNQAKAEFWNGIVVDRDDVETYVEEADCILIGPGMTRSPDTEQITNHLLKKYPDKKWVIDAGALQMVEPNLINKNCILTPHVQEFFLLYRKMARSYLVKNNEGEARIEIGGETAEYSLELTKKIEKNPQYPLLFENEMHDFLDNHTPPSSKHIDSLLHASKGLNQSLVLIKGKNDLLVQYLGDYDKSLFLSITGGNAGMTKGGTGDVLAGLIAALYCTNDAWTAAVVGSYINKKAGELLYETVGPYFNSSDLVEAVPKAMWQALAPLPQAQPE